MDFIEYGIYVLQLLVNMDDFQTFQQLFRFFLSNELDATHVQKIDEKTDLAEGKILIREVSSFHQMRADFCKSIIEHVGESPLFSSFVHASSCLQYDQVPTKSTCILTGVELLSKDGILIVVDNIQLFTFHKRLKVIVLNLWYILHLPEELIKESIQWFTNNNVTGKGKVNNEEVVSKIIEYNNSMFAKRAYVRLLNSVSFIQNEMRKITVN